MARASAFDLLGEVPGGLSHLALGRLAAPPGSAQRDLHRRRDAIFTPNAAPDQDGAAAERRRRVGGFVGQMDGDDAISGS
jgi:hypothetical protein